MKNNNIGVYLPKTDTCQRCDKFKAQLQSGISDEERRSLQHEQQIHHARAAACRDLLKEAKNEPSHTLVITFDMQKTQPLPQLTTSVVYYSRQLWVYNLGIHEVKSGKAFMCMWTEDMGRKGAKEVASSIYAYLKQKDLTDIKRIVSFSDACGGQNRNKTIVSFMLAVCNEFDLTWSHCFMASGHSYLPNDRDFGLIEKAKKRQLQVFSLEQWENVVLGARDKSPFCILKPPLFDLEKLTSRHSFRTTNTVGEKVSWLKMKRWEFQPGNRSFQYSYSCEPAGLFYEVDLTKGRNTRTASVDLLLPELPLAYPKGVPISSAKFKDLLALLPYVPSQYHPFFQTLKHDGTSDEFLPDEDMDD